MTGTVSDVAPSTITCCVRLLRKALIHPCVETHHEITDVKMAAKSSKQTFIKSKHMYTRISFNMIVFITKKIQSFRGRDRCLHFFLKLKHNYRDVPKVSGHCDFLLYISCKTTFFKNIIPKSTLFRF